MIRTFLAWWGTQLWLILPASVRSALAGREVQNAVLLALINDRTSMALDVERRDRRRATRLGRFAIDPASLARLRATLGRARGAIRLLLPSPLVLEQQVTLPLAAEAGLDTALRWELDRLTPFQADDVFWSWQIEQRDRQRGRLLLNLRLVPKMAVAATLESLAAAGLAPAVLARADDPSCTVPLPGHRTGSRGRLLAAAGLLCALLLLATAALPFIRQQGALAKLDHRIDTLRPAVDVADNLRRRLSERAANADVLAGERARVGNTVRMLATLTDLLPDDTYLLGLTLKDRIVTLTGQSTAAAKLIPTLAADPSIRDPVFVAPVTRNEQTGQEAFTIRAEMRP